MNTPTFRKSPLFRFIALTVLTAFAGMLPVQPSYAQVSIVMPAPGVMIHVTRHFEPPQMVGLKVDLKDPFSFNFIMDQGQNPMSDADKKEEFNKIIKYFLVSLAMPNKDMWVNLSPYESTRMIPPVFGQTEMGRDLLAQDYILKQFTASLMYPEDALGKKFWSKVYSQAQERFGTTEISVNTFNKVWIVADHADIYQKDDSAFLVNSHLKVMLEQDYMALSKNKEQFGNIQNKDIHMDAKAQMASQVVRQIIIPAIEKEVNEGKSFAAVRQVYSAEIMATWFKKTLRASLLGQVFANKSKIAGQKISDPQVMEKIYKQYLRAYKKGVFNYIKEDASPDGQVIPRKYFSGGFQAVSRDAVTAFNLNNATTAQKAMAVRMAGGWLTKSKLLIVGAVLIAANTLTAFANTQGDGAANQMKFAGTAVHAVSPVKTPVATSATNQAPIKVKSRDKVYDYLTAGSHRTVGWMVNAGTNGIANIKMAGQKGEKGDIAIFNGVKLVGDALEGTAGGASWIVINGTTLVWVAGAHGGYWVIDEGVKAVGQGAQAVGHDIKWTYDKTGKKITQFAVFVEKKGGIVIKDLKGNTLTFFKFEGVQFKQAGHTFVQFLESLANIGGAGFNLDSSKSKDATSRANLLEGRLDTAVQMVNNLTGELAAAKADANTSASTIKSLGDKLNAALEDVKAKSSEIQAVNAEKLAIQQGATNAVIAAVSQKAQVDGVTIIALQNRVKELEAAKAIITPGTNTADLQISNINNQIAFTNQQIGLIEQNASNLDNVRKAAVKLQDSQRELKQAQDHVASLWHEWELAIIAFLSGVLVAKKLRGNGPNSHDITADDIEKAAGDLVMAKDDQRAKEEQVARDAEALKTAAGEVKETPAPPTPAENQEVVKPTASPTEVPANAEIQAQIDQINQQIFRLRKEFGKVVSDIFVIENGNHPEQADALKELKSKKDALNAQIDALLAQKAGLLSQQSQPQNPPAQSASVNTSAPSAETPVPSAEVPVPSVKELAPVLNLGEELISQVTALSKDTELINAIGVSLDENLAKPENVGLAERDFVLARALEALERGISYDEVIRKDKDEKDNPEDFEKVNKRARQIYDSRVNPNNSFVSHQQIWDETVKVQNGLLNAKKEALTNFQNQLTKITDLTQKLDEEKALREAKREEGIQQVNNDFNNRRAQEILNVRYKPGSLEQLDLSKQPAAVAQALSEMTGSKVKLEELLPDVQRLFDGAKDKEAKGDAEAFSNMDKLLVALIAPNDVERERSLQEIVNKYKQMEQESNTQKELDTANQDLQNIEKNDFVAQLLDKVKASQALQPPIANPPQPASAVEAVVTALPAEQKLVEVQVKESSGGASLEQQRSELAAQLIEQLNTLVQDQPADPQAGAYGALIAYLKQRENAAMSTTRENVNIGIAIRLVERMRDEGDKFSNQDLALLRDICTKLSDNETIKGLLAQIGVDLNLEPAQAQGDQQQSVRPSSFSRVKSFLGLGSTVEKLKTMKYSLDELKRDQGEVQSKLRNVDALLAKVENNLPPGVKIDASKIILNDQKSWLTGVLGKINNEIAHISEKLMPALITVAQKEVEKLETDLVNYEIELTAHINNIAHHRSLLDAPEARLIGNDSPAFLKESREQIAASEKRRGIIKGEQKKLNEKVGILKPMLSKLSPADKISTTIQGGINLTDENLVINIKVDGAGMPLPPQFQDKAMLNLSGLTSIIRRISPLTPENVPALYELIK